MKAQVNGVSINYLDEGDPKGAPVVFSNSLGTDLHLWDTIMVGGVFCITDQIVFLITHKLKSSGPDRLDRQLLGRLCFQQFIGIFLGKDTCKVHGQVGKERGFWPAQNKLDLMISQLDHIFDYGTHFHGFKILVGATVDFVIRVILETLSVE